MKLGVHAGLWMAKWTDEITPILKIIADIGFDGVEISLLGMDQHKAKSLNKIIKDFNLEVTCSDGLSISADITSSDNSIVGKGIEHLKWGIETSSLLGSNNLAGVVYAPWGVFDPKNKAVRAERSAEALSKLDEFLIKHNINLGIEAINRFETDLINTANEAILLAEASKSRNIGVLLDTFHLNIEEKDIKSAIIKTGKHLKHFHISENDRGIPGSGHIPWGDVKEGLQSINYNNWIVAEMFVISGNPSSSDLNIWRNIETDPTKAAQKSLKFMRDFF
jgi:D-psicose/D-tagatose/L-ribulose 3-epimerase